MQAALALLPALPIHWACFFKVTCRKWPIHFYDANQHKCECSARNSSAGALLCVVTCECGICSHVAHCVRFMWLLAQTLTVVAQTVWVYIVRTSLLTAFGAAHSCGVKRRPAAQAGTPGRRAGPQLARTRHAACGLVEHESILCACVLCGLSHACLICVDIYYATVVQCVHFS